MLRDVFKLLVSRGAGEEFRPKYVVSDALNEQALTAHVGDLNRHGALFLVDVRDLSKKIKNFNQRPDTRDLRLSLRVTSQFDQEILPDLLRPRNKGEIQLNAVAGLALGIGTQRVALDWVLGGEKSHFRMHTDGFKRTPTSMLNLDLSKTQSDFDNFMIDFGGKLGARQLAATLSMR